MLHKYIRNTIFLHQEMHVNKHDTCVFQRGIKTKQLSPYFSTTFNIMMHLKVQRKLDIIEQLRTEMNIKIIKNNQRLNMVHRS